MRNKTILVLLFFSLFFINNLCCVSGLIIEDTYPVNESIVQDFQPTLLFNISNEFGLAMNYSVFTGNSSSNTSALLTTVNTVSNSSRFFVCYYNATVPGSDYWWRVYVWSSNQSYNESFYFTPVQNTGYTIGNSGAGLGIGISMGSFCFALLVLLTVIRKRGSEA